MDIRVSGHQVDAGAAFREHVETRLTALIDKYFPRALKASVTLGPGPHGDFTCDIVMHVMADLILKGTGRGGLAQGAFDAAAERIDKQLRRYMRRLKDRHGPGNAVQNGAVLPELDGGAFDNAGYTVFAAGPEEEPHDSPLIIAETRVDIPDATVGDAVMMLDLRNTTALLFKNSGTGAHNMVYRREDGSIGWVEPRA